MSKYRGIKPLGRNKYEVRVRITDPKTGKERDGKRICNGSLRDALALQDSLRSELQGGGRRKRMTLGDYARSWFERTAMRVRPQTAKTYETGLRHILAFMGHYMIDAIRPMDVEAFQSAQIAAGYSGRFVSSQLKLLRQLSRDAQINEVIDRDFCLGVLLRKKPAKYTEDEPNLLSADELDRLLAVVPDEWYPMVATLAFTGMRFGELSGLKWDDIDGTRQVITVRRTNYRGTMGPTKTEAGTRVIPIAPDLYPVLQAHRADLIARQHPGLVEGWVFASSKGTPYIGSPLSEFLGEWLGKAGITKRLTPHGLRRTFNDLLDRVAKGRVVRGIIGHTSVKMTMAYSMVDIDEKHEAHAAVMRLVTNRAPDRAARDQREDFREDDTPSPAEEDAKMQ